MRKVSIAIIAMFLLISCTQRGCQKFKRKNQLYSRQYDIKMYSGDSCVFHDSFKGIINQEDNSDGIYYFKGDTLIEIGGNYIIKSDK